MIVYANRKRCVKTRIREDNWRDAIIRFGEIEAAIADSLCPEWDEPHPLLERLRSIAIQAAGGDISILGDLPTLPAEIWVSVPEGYAFYAVYPEDYGKAALRFCREVRPQSAVVIGIRSIGTSLSAAVAATLQQAGCAVRSFTVRPRGHPFDRRLSVRGYEWEPHSHFLVVDEGPGLSGSSFASVATFLSERGIPDDRIVLFPSWDTDGASFVSPTARERWTRHRKYREIRGPIPDSRDLSAGQWRRWSIAAPPVQPQHERRKYLRNSRLLKFEGLSDYGRAKLARARILADAGFIPRPASLQDGYLESEWISGQPVDEKDPSVAEWITRYLQFLENTFPSDRSVPYQENLEMIRVNVDEGLGPQWISCVDQLEQLRPAVCDRQTTEIDGRLLPHELLRTANGYVKTDTLDHYDDHFFPGCQDIAWDVAAACLEFGVSQIANLVPQPCLSFYKIAYLSHRLGYCTMAVESGHDADGFRALARQYRYNLRNELSRLC